MSPTVAEPYQRLRTNIEDPAMDADIDLAAADLQNQQPDPLSETDKTPRAPVQRQDNACTECRKHKIRCHPGEPSRWPCKRCVKQHLDCEVLQHHRGRKRKQPPGGSDDHPQQPQDGKQHVALHSSSNNQIATADHVKTSDPSPTVAERPTPEAERLVAGGSEGSIPRPESPNVPKNANAATSFPDSFSSLQTSSSSASGFPLHPPGQGRTLSPHVAGNEPLAITGNAPPTSSRAFASNPAQFPSPQSTLPGAPLSAMRFPFLDGNATDPSQHAGQRVSMFSLRSLLNGQDTSDPTLPAASPFHTYCNNNSGGGSGSNGARHGSDESEQYTLDPVSAGLMDITTAHAHFRRFISEINPLVFVFDLEVHTHDRVRASSAFLYSTIIAVSTRYGTTTAEERETNQQCWALVRNHIKMSAFRDERSIERVMALLVLGAFGESEERSTSSIFPIAVSTARLLGLGRIAPPNTSAAEQKIYRICQRIWLALFVSNSVAFLQHNLYQSIPWNDPLVSSASTWHEDASPAMRPLDTLLISSVQNRRSMFHYQSLLSSLSEPYNNPINGTSISIITRSAQREMDHTNALWREEMERIGAPQWMQHKSIIWHNASKLKLNLSIVSHALRAPGSNFAPPNMPHRQADVGGLLSFHIAIVSARTVLERFLQTEAKAVVFSSDSFLHLLLYASFFLWSISADTNEAFMGRRKAQECTQLITKVAGHLQSCSFDPQDSCGLHARFLRLLLQTPTSSMPSAPSRPGTASGRSHAAAATPAGPSANGTSGIIGATAVSADDGESGGIPTGPSESEGLVGLGNPIAVPQGSLAFDPLPQLGAMATDPGANSIDLNALFNGRVTDEFAWAFPANMDLAATPT